MKLHQFLQLSERQQLLLTEKRGVSIASRKTDSCTVRLYQLGSLYVELYQHDHFNVTTRICPFHDTALLEPYLDAISLDELFAPL